MALEVHTIQEPLWIRALVEEVVKEAMWPLGFIGPLGFRYWEPEAPTNTFAGWQVVVYPTLNEAAGPHKHDGNKFVSGFRLNVGHIVTAMGGSVESIVWNSPVGYNGDLDGPEISVQGHFCGKHVWLRVFHLPPPDEPVACYVDLQTGRAWAHSA